MNSSHDSAILVEPSELFVELQSLIAVLERQVEHVDERAQGGVIHRTKFEIVLEPSNLSIKLRIKNIARK